MDIYNAIAEPNRRKILETLRTGEKPVTDLVAAVGMSQPVVSKHLRILREAGLVEAKPNGQQRLYRLKHEPLQELAEWITPFETFWNQRLNDLEKHLDQMASDAQTSPKK